MCLFIYFLPFLVCTVLHVLLLFYYKFHWYAPIWSSKIVQYCTIVQFHSLSKILFLRSIFFSFGTTAPSGPGPPHSRGFCITHNDAPQYAGLPWTSDQLVAETSTDNTWHSQQTEIHAPSGIRTHSLSRRAALNLRLKPRDHWDGPKPPLRV